MRKDGPTKVWLCTDCEHCEVSQGPEPDWQWWYRCLREDGKKIRISKYSLGRDVYTPLWCPFVKEWGKDAREAM